MIAEKFRTFWTSLASGLDGGGLKNFGRFEPGLTRRPMSTVTLHAVRKRSIKRNRPLNEGVDIKDVLTEYKNDIDNHCCKLVCHNLNFDKAVVMSELIRADMDVNNVESICTMLTTINYCKLTPKIRGEYKWASLEQLYHKMFAEDIENAHTSYYDVINTAK